VRHPWNTVGTPGRISGAGLALTLAAVLPATGCRPKPAEPNGSDAWVMLRGAVSTFSAEAYYRWFNQLTVNQAINSSFEVVGSGVAIQRFLASEVDYASTETAPTASEISQARRGLVSVPVTAGAIAVVYNLPDCDLRLSRSQLVGVFSGEITDFAALGCASQTLEVVHRQDASGSTANVTATLAALSDRWRQRVGSGRQVRWPVGLPAQGAKELVARVRERPGRIGYVESAYVRPPLQAAALENSAGEWLHPTAGDAARALDVVPLNRQLVGSNPDPRQGYPIVNFSWMLVPQRGLGTRLPALQRSLRFMLSQAGQDATELLGYVPLPARVRQQALRMVDQLGP
jgi:phosphate transport system substrate-binding protein